jgi:predicted TIM-barrel fold metal-dependent hydrolase
MMKRIDCEMHVGKFVGDLYTWLDHPIGPEELEGVLDEHNFDMTLVMPPTLQSPDNASVGKAIRGHPRLIGFAMINPCEPDGGVAELERSVGEWGMKGLKLVPLRHGYDIDTEVPIRVMQCAERLGLPVSIHSGAHYCLPWQIADLARKFPTVPIIMDHMGWRYYVDGAINVAMTTPNIYLETAMVSQPGCIKLAVSKIGADRVIYGSDYPTGDPASMLATVKAARLKPEEEAWVLGGTLARIMRIE